GDLRIRRVGCEGARRRRAGCPERKGEYRRENEQTPKSAAHQVTSPGRVRIAELGADDPGRDSISAWRKLDDSPADNSVDNPRPVRARIRTVRVDEISDRLYALPPEEFTQARNEAERDLRNAGERGQADRVKAQRKPTAVAEAVNRLARSHRSKVEQCRDAAAKLRDAQFAGKGDLGAADQAELAAL